MRSALTYRKQALLRALGFEKSGLHTRLEVYVCFDIWVLGASPLCGVGLSASIYFAALRKFRFNPLRLAPPARQRVSMRYALAYPPAPASGLKSATRQHTRRRVSASALEFEKSGLHTRLAAGFLYI
jgi:hypothetical protein